MTQENNHQTPSANSARESLSKDSPQPPDFLRQSAFNFGTKAETLTSLEHKLSSAAIPPIFFFSLAEWRKNPTTILFKAAEKFGRRMIAVRSSAKSEDTQNQSNAGAFDSVLNVNSQDVTALNSSIEKVISSYTDQNDENQILLQEMVSEVSMSGVIMTYDLSSGSPYYVINYDDCSGRTDVITGGRGSNKTVFIHHDADYPHIESERLRSVMKVVHELELMCGSREPLDIEFAMGHDGTVFLLQVRRIVASKQWTRAGRAITSDVIENIEIFLGELMRPQSGLAGKTTILGQMPDWNPAEMIGLRPRPLALSLYKELITDEIWAKARELIGYRAVTREPLMIDLGGQPFVDIRKSFNSFLPAGLNQKCAEVLVDAWLARLAEHPEFHDKVEFEVAQTIYHFNFENEFKARFSGTLSPDEFAHYKKCLKSLSIGAVSIASDSSLRSALNQVDALSPHESAGGITPKAVLELVDNCKHNGTLPFAVVARHAFIAETLLRSAVVRGAIETKRIDDFKRSLRTVTWEFTNDFQKLQRKEIDRQAFLKRYGHLRPGTYDLLSLRYDQRDDLWNVDEGDYSSQSEPLSFQWSPGEHEAIQALLDKAGYNLNADEFLDYARLAISGRESVKFNFTRLISDILELVAKYCERYALTRDDVSFLKISDIKQLASSPVVRNRESHFHHIVDERRTFHREIQGLRLGYLIRSVRDIYVIPLHRSAPNFVTQKDISGPVLFLNNTGSNTESLRGKIVCIENADPGYDWIFARAIGGLITKFGGANSHMTVRCAELGLAAAIGVGEQLFDRLKSCAHIELRCAEKIVRPI